MKDNDELLSVTPETSNDAKATSSAVAQSHAENKLYTALHRPKTSIGRMEESKSLE